MIFVPIQAPHLIEIKAFKNTSYIYYRWKRGFYYFGETFSKLLIVFMEPILFEIFICAKIQVKTRKYGFFETADENRKKKLTNL